MTEKLTITPVETAKERTEFIHFQWEVYKDDPYWVPPLLSEREEFLNPVHGHPFHRHATVRYFMARRNGRPVGRIAALINENHNLHWNERVGFFGLYEVLDDREASDALLEAAEAFVRQQGMSAIRGPMNFSTNEECGLLVDGWNGPPLAMMTYNPRYYVDLIEEAGYVKAMDLLAYLTDLTQYKLDGTGINPKLRHVAEKVRERTNATVRPFNFKNFDAEAERFKQIYNAAWAKNWGFVPLTEAELDAEIRSLKPIIDPATIFFAEKEGQTIGAMLPLPDLNQALIRAYPRPGVPEWWTMAKMLYWWKVRGVVTTIRAFAGGFIEEYRGLGLDALLAMACLEAVIRRGYRLMETSWILENNIPMRQMAEILDGKVYRTYRIYEKALKIKENL